MKSGTGSHELTRLITAYLTSVAFGLTFVVATIAGAGGGTALWRGVIAAALAFAAGHVLAPPAVDAVLTAVAREQAKQKASPPRDGAP